MYDKCRMSVPAGAEAVNDPSEICNSLVTGDGAKKLEAVGCIARRAYLARSCVPGGRCPELKDPMMISLFFGRLFTVSSECERVLDNPTYINQRQYSYLLARTDLQSGRTRLSHSSYSITTMSHKKKKSDVTEAAIAVEEPHGYEFLGP